jgi:hypothetical protein
MRRGPNNSSDPFLPSIAEPEEADVVDALFAAVRVVSTTAGVKLDAARFAAFSVLDAARVGSNLVDAVRAGSTDVARRRRARAALTATKIAERSGLLDGPMATAALSAAQRDYEILRREFGEHNDVAIGAPIDLSVEWWRQRGGEI